MEVMDIVMEEEEEIMGIVMEETITDTDTVMMEDMDIAMVVEKMLETVRLCRLDIF